MPKETIETIEESIVKDLMAQLDRQWNRGDPPPHDYLRALVDQHIVARLSKVPTPDGIDALIEDVENRYVITLTERAAAYTEEILRVMAERTRPLGSCEAEDRDPPPPERRRKFRLADHLLTD